MKPPKTFIYVLISIFFVYLSGCHPARLVKINRPEGTHQLSYTLYLPAENPWTAKPLPLLVVLHGAGGQRRDTTPAAIRNTPLMALYEGELRGEELGREAVKELDPHIRKSLVLIPSNPQTWKAEQLDLLLEEIYAEYPADPNRLYLTGWSMGGWGSWEYASAYPEKVAALIPVCGGSEADPTLAETPTWMFHDFNDNIVQASYSQDLILSGLFGFPTPSKRAPRHLLLTRTGYPHEEENSNLSAGEIFTLGWFGNQYDSWEAGTNSSSPNRYTVTIFERHAISRYVYSLGELWDWVYSQQKE